ncbi:MAG: PDZ domain-containing protein [Planctomycetes bacterium]|nr:PDZ domain-containing protein [Planctomycetota bacterium]
MLQRTIILLAAISVGSLSAFAADGKLEALEEQAFKQAAALVDPSLVRIETVGGLEQVGEVLLGTGPTSGLVVSEDGYIISSSFNFVSKPASILVTLADGRRFPARQVANDKLRLLTLLKIDAAGLSPAKAAPRGELRVGQWTIALGRTFDLTTPSVSVGIVSAVNRIWGKAIQTDAKTSPVNYGGALVDIEGRVLGVIVPLSPQGNGETAGVEWYDGGIGFAIPLEDVYASLERLKTGNDLLPGLLGITFAGGQATNVPAIVDRVRYNSPAQQAGLKTNDRVIEADGEKIVRVAQLKHVMGRKYDGDSVKLTVQREDKTVNLEARLVGELIPYEVPYLGMLPKRAATAEPGVGVRFVFAESPAAKAGLLRGDRVLLFNDSPATDPRTLSDLVGRSRPGDSVKLTCVHDGKQIVLDVTLGTVPDTIVDELSGEVIEKPAAVEKPADAEKKEDADKPADASPGEAPKTGRFADDLAGHDHSYWAFVPSGYNPAVAYGLMVWIHPGGDTMEATMIKEWAAECERRGIILVGPKSDQVARWMPGEAKFIEGLVTHIREKYTIDPQRIFLHSHGNGAQMASLLISRQRELFRGLALAGAPLVGPVADQEPDFRQQFFFVVGEDDKALAPVKKTVEALRKLKFPAALTTVKGLGAKYPSAAEIDQIARWADCLDRI